MRESGSFFCDSLWLFRRFLVHNNQPKAAFNVASNAVKGAKTESSLLVFLTCPACKLRDCFSIREKLSKMLTFDFCPRS